MKANVGVNEPGNVNASAESKEGPAKVSPEDMNERHDRPKPLTNEEAEELAARRELEKTYGQVWNTAEVQQAFEVTGFLSPLCYATRRCDGVKGCLRFTHNPRFYFDFTEEL